ncbi:hypothetical protein ACWA2B_10735 [Paenibacillus sp. CMM36]
MRLKTKDWFAFLVGCLFLGYAIYSFQNPDASSENVASVMTTGMKKLIDIVAIAANKIHMVIN